MSGERKRMLNLSGSAGLFGSKQYPENFREPKAPKCERCRDTMYVPKSVVVDGREVIGQERCPEPCPARDAARRRLEAERKELVKDEPVVFPEDERKKTWYDER